MVFAQTKHPMREALEDLLESSYIPQNHRFLDSSEKFSRLSRNLSELQNYFYGICELGQSGLVGLYANQINSTPLTCVAGTLFVDAASRVVLGQGVIATAREIYSNLTNTYKKQ